MYKPYHSVYILSQLQSHQVHHPLYMNSFAFVWTTFVVYKSYHHQMIQWLEHCALGTRPHQYILCIQYIQYMNIQCIPLFHLFQYILFERYNPLFQYYLLFLGIHHNQYDQNILYIRLFQYYQLFL